MKNKKEKSPADQEIVNNVIALIIIIGAIVIASAARTFVDLTTFSFWG